MLIMKKYFFLIFFSESQKQINEFIMNILNIILIHNIIFLPHYQSLNEEVWSKIWNANSALFWIFLSKDRKYLIQQNFHTQHLIEMSGVNFKHIISNNEF